MSARPLHDPLAPAALGATTETRNTTCYMRPALSVLLLTTLIGAGQGLFVALFAVAIATYEGILPPAGPAFHRGGALVALAFLGGGLIASFFHLGRPERA